METNAIQSITNPSKPTQITMHNKHLWRWTMTLRFWPCRRNSLVRTCRVARRSRGTAYPIFNINKSTERHLCLRNATLNIENWVVPPLRTWQMVEHTTTIRRNSGGTIIIRSRFIEISRGPHRNLRKAWMNRGTWATTRTNTHREPMTPVVNMWTRLRWAGEKEIEAMVWLVISMPATLRCPTSNLAPSWIGWATRVRTDYQRFTILTETDKMPLAYKDVERTNLYIMQPVMPRFIPISGSMGTTTASKITTPSSACCPEPSRRITYIRITLGIGTGLLLERSRCYKAGGKIRTVFWWIGIGGKVNLRFIMGSHLRD